MGKQVIVNGKSLIAGDVEGMIKNIIDNRYDDIFGMVIAERGFAL